MYKQESTAIELIVDRVELWAASIPDNPGELSKKLAGLKNAGADLDFIIARRDHERPGYAVLFIDPLRREREMTAAQALGFTASKSVYSVRVEGDNRPGIAADITQRIAEAGLNLRGFSASTCGSRFLMYLGFDVAEDADRSMAILQYVNNKPRYVDQVEADPDVELRMSK